MAICYQLVTEALNGTISVSSSFGSGTEFTIDFPAVAPAKASERRMQKVQ